MGNPFGKQEPAQNRSAWDRMDESYKNLCRKIAGRNLSPQNKRVRAAADLHLANLRAGD